jgi:uncharacterized phage-associated protein
MSIIAHPNFSSAVDSLPDGDFVKIRFRFNHAKGQAMLEYLLKLVGGRYNYMALLKLVFFSDRWHIRNHAVPVSADEYFAMKFGPIPSNLYRIVKAPGSTGDYELELKEEGNDYESLSVSDRHAMQFSVDNFGTLGKYRPFDLALLTHAYPEWYRYEKRFEENQNGREDMDYRDFLLDPSPDRPEFSRLGMNDPFTPLSPEEREDLMQEMIERTILL